MKWGLPILVGLIVLMGISVFGVVDMTLYRQMPYYTQMLQRIDSIPTVQDSGDTLKVGWAKVNLGPPYPVPIAIAQGHHNKDFERVEDSIWVRAFVFDNGLRKAAYVTMDMLIVPPTVTQQLDSALAGSGFNLNNTYLTATHCHNSIGAWGPGLIGKIFAGKYDQKLVNHITHCIVQAIKQADGDKVRARIGYKDIDAHELVYNRLVGNKSSVDPWLHLVKIVRDDSSTALMATFAAHATTLAGDYMNLHRDYPGELVDLMASLPGVSFAAFSAGAVGSMGPVFADLPHLEQKDSMAVNVFRRIKEVEDTLPTHYVTELNAFRVPLLLRGMCFRVANRIRIRPWVAKELVGDYPLSVCMLRVGNVLYAGMPCDFSGELTAPLMHEANERHLTLVVTSFNGGYMGYITRDDWYDMNAYETRTMNWYGPYNGTYLSEVVTRLMRKI